MPQSLTGPRPAKYVPARRAGRHPPFTFVSTFVAVAAGLPASGCLRYRLHSRLATGL
jgi:hypothetical protein